MQDVDFLGDTLWVFEPCGSGEPFEIGDDQSFVGCRFAKHRAWPLAVFAGCTDKWAADVIDIRYAYLALAISENQSVQDFAQTMIRDHVAVNEAATALVTKLNVVPQDNELSQALNSGAADKRDELSGLRGAAFDCAYAQNELGYHQIVNETVEVNFIPGATVPELKELLTDALVAFKQHESQAEAIVSGLNCGRMIMLSRRKICGALAGAAIFAPFGARVSQANDGARTHHVMIRNFAFVPATLTVRPGDTVAWTNRDIAPHTATQRDGSWDTGGLSKGQSGSIHFPQPGQIEYFCAFHPAMTGQIIVTAD